MRDLFKKLNFSLILKSFGGALPTLHCNIFQKSLRIARDKTPEK
jgi:hypothetical protein